MHKKSNWKNDGAEHIYFPVKIYNYSIYSMVSTVLSSLYEITKILVSLHMRNYGNYFKIYLFMSFRTSRDIVGRFFTMLNANIGLCSQVRPNFL